MKEEVIKFSYEFINQEVPKIDEIKSLNEIRQVFFERKLIGVGKDGISYGNISQRLSEKSFLITASQTGFKKILEPKDYVIIHNFDISRNKVLVSGINLPSSESLTHAAVYLANPLSMFVVHFHHKLLWTKFLSIFPKTVPGAGYGSLELAQSLYEIVLSEKGKNNSIIILGGHQDGIIAYANQKEELINSVISLLEDWKQT